MDDFSTGYICYMPSPCPLTGFGAWVVTSRYEIMNETKNYITVDDIGNGKVWIKNTVLDSSKCRTCFYDQFICERTQTKTMMLGAICGDVAGSIYEHNNIKYIPDKDRLIDHYARFTDDSVLTLAVAEGIMNGMRSLKKVKDFNSDDEPVFADALTKSIHKWGNLYPYAGYGGAFRRWLASENPEPYNSWGNGSAMRASYAGWIAQSLEDAEFLATASASVTHNHPDGIKGAVAIAGSIYLLRNSDPADAKETVKHYVSKLYDLDFTLDEIRPVYHFDVSCQGSVPQAIQAFLEGESFSEVLALAISIGGDSDTIAAMAGSLAEVIYPIPDGMRDRVLKRLDYTFKSCLAGTIDFLIDNLNKISGLESSAISS